ncbi:hypothetical protein KSP40_PGU000677 [Platanthera guangdongensis]|uniref:Glabrous enhancer-binding protein-like DBD domain-containing protein n=1 Tax=Platanthera guangdongensis TaxID=2320717 RepID=A0ABR2M0E0_9ASPA
MYNKEAAIAPPAAAASSPSSSSSASSSSTQEVSSPTPAYSPVKKPSADFTVSVLRMHAEPSSESTAHEKRSNPPLLIRESQYAVSEDEFETSSDSNTSAPPPHGSSHRVSDPSLMPLSSTPMDDRGQCTHKNPVSGKRLATPSPQISQKKRRTADIVGEDGGQAKKEISRRICCKVDELSLLQCILDYKENHHVIPSTPVQLRSLLKVWNDSLSTSVTLTQMNAKIRVLRKKYDNATKIVKGTDNQHVSNAHCAAVFDLSTKIWGSNLDSHSLENKIKPEIISTKEIKGKVKSFAAEYPFLHQFLKSENLNYALVFESQMSTAKAKKLEADCKKLEIAEIQLHIKKMKLLPSALKLIEDTLAE